MLSEVYPCAWHLRYLSFKQPSKNGKTSKTKKRTPNYNNGNKGFKGVLELVTNRYTAQLSCRRIYLT